MLDQAELLVALAVATLVVPLAFVAVVAVAWRRRNAGAPVGARLEAALALLGGASLGTMALMGTFSVVVAAPIVVAGLLLVGMTWRRGRRVLAGWLVVGLALPATIVSAAWAIEALANGAAPAIPADATAAAAVLLVALAFVVAGLGVVAAGDPDGLPAGRAYAAPGVAHAAPGVAPAAPVRSLSMLGQAIMEPSRIGPFSAPTVAALAALVVGWLAVSVVPFPAPLVTFAAAVAVSSILATEAYIRAMPSTGRRSFEAFSWLGEHELERARALTGSPVPTSRRGAVRWLREHAETPEIAGLRAEVLLLAGDVDAARATVERMPIATPAERADREATRALVEWLAGGDPDLVPLETSVRAIEPDDSDPRLRAEVSLAAARVRGRLGRGEAEPLAPLLEVRERLGRRADGQVGRALRKRMIPAFLVWGLAFGLILQIVEVLDRPPA